MLFKSVVVLAVAFLTSTVSAQAGANSTIDPNTVSLTLRNQWCSAQQNTCATLCAGDGGANPNTCSGETLAFTCECGGNSSAPGLQYYTGTMPTFICEQLFINCIANNANIKAAQDKCTSDEKTNCGHLDPAKFVAQSSTSSAVASATPTPTTDGSAGAANTAATSSSSTAAGATMMAGSGALAAGVAAAFGMLL